MSEVVIPAEAVEAAAKAAFASAWRGCAWDGRDGTTEETRERFRREARAALEAAAPHIAGAWHDAVSEAYVEGALSLEQASVMWNKNPYRTPNAH